jgi:isochorismate synthase/2-succinyl-5-enolpyruvyl-6-hydroxy-3-cyclohexene-1-carboxylate synthase/2-succinyl-6-hydroxy-2,4-cyclohexadiene-1-carboxylate synthase/O-succinylbenzoate synthase
MCRAQGIPHIKVATAADLRTALRSAWALNRHSVVEVTTDRASNVDRHRQIQRAAQAAMAAALPLLQLWQSAGPAGLAPTTDPDAMMPLSSASAGGLWEAPAALPSFGARIEAASYQPYSLPLARTLTTSAGEAMHRHGFLLRVAVAGPSRQAGPPSSGVSGGSSGGLANGRGPQLEKGSELLYGAAAVSNGSSNGSSGGSGVPAPAPSSSLVWGIGEVAPLPGLSAESAQQAEQQLVMLCELLRGAQAPATLALLKGRFEDWLQHGLGIGPGTLHASVRAGLEAAVLSALAQVSGAEGTGEGAAPGAL